MIRCSRVRTFLLAFTVGWASVNIYTDEIPVVFPAVRSESSFIVRLCREPGSKKANWEKGYEYFSSEKAANCTRGGGGGSGIEEEVEEEASLGYWPAVVELKGKIGVRTFFGPPNFGENPKTDSKERSRILYLDKPINVRAKDETDPVSGPSVNNVRELQLIFDGSLENLIGKKVIVKGTLLQAHTGHHHTDVLLDVQSIDLAPQPPNR